MWPCTQKCLLRDKEKKERDKPVRVSYTWLTWQENLDQAPGIET